MRFAVCLLGTEVFAVSLTRDDVTTEDVVAAFHKAVNGKQDDEEAHDLTGGHFERDLHPLDPNDRYPEWEDKFGFGNK